MSSASSTPVPLSRDEINDVPLKPAGFDFIAKDVTPPPSPPETQDSIAVLIAEDIARKDKWGWWQGYRKDRRLLGFEVPCRKNPMVKKGLRPKRKDDGDNEG